MAILSIEGISQKGNGDFTKRMTRFQSVFEEAVGESLQIGTLNVRVPHEIKVNAHFRIEGSRIGEPNQHLLFEVCRVNAVWAYRIRPFQPASGGGGHGDHIIEIASHVWIPNSAHGSKINIEFFR